MFCVAELILNSHTVIKTLILALFWELKSLYIGLMSFRTWNYMFIASIGFRITTVEIEFPCWVSISLMGFFFQDRNRSITTYAGN